MASILFDDITFPRELYDPETFEFVAPVSTLLAFTPHILSQLAKTESEQEPMPIPTASKGKDTKDSSRSSNSNSNSSGEDSKNKNSDQPKAENASTPTPGIFSSIFQNITASGLSTALDNGLYLAGRYKEGSSSSSRDREYQRERNQHNASTNERTSFSSWEKEDAARNSRDRNRNSYWFGRGQDSSSYSRSRDHERERLREMEKRLQQMERDMRYNSAMARSEVESQRRERFKLEQELEAQKTKVKKLEAEMEERRKQEAEMTKKQKQKEKDESEAREREKVKVAKKTEKEKAVAKSTSDDKEEKEDDEKKALLKKENDSAAVAASTVLVAAVGVASLAMSLYSAHKALAIYLVVSFHDQLELLMSQCEGVIQSTEAWISEQFLEVPEQIPEDLKMIKELIDTIRRLDPSGGTLVVGCALYGIVTRARYNGPEYKGARTMMELKAAQTLRSLGVNPISPSTTAGGNARMSLIHDSRIDRLRLEFEKRDGHDLRDADEIDGLVVEDALDMESFSAPFVSQKSVTSAGTRKKNSQANEDAPVLSDSSYKLEEFEGFKPSLKMKSYA
ncbi:hypothetical protein BGZ80_010951 [Entomortierella chlamydospora]|uniref:Uncharacterized protein n=1 Tax=Entomortierella chlamydospora TaxID=101097 RepID=A0A9P6MU42_9FUNG|nr:hypothetical protein BGZ80_010951 [Entomortierella chlamydospora]